MDKATEDKIVDFIENHTEKFQQWELDKLRNLTLEALIGLKNPYFLNQGRYLLVGSLIDSLLIEYFQPYEEAFVDSLMKKIVILYQGQWDEEMTTALQGVDLEFEKDKSVWEFVSGDGHLYKEINKLLVQNPKETSEEFHKSYAQMLNLFALEFMERFCEAGVIKWENVIQLHFQAGKTIKKQNHSSPNEV